MELFVLKADIIVWIYYQRSLAMAFNKNYRCRAFGQGEKKELTSWNVSRKCHILGMLGLHSCVDFALASADDGTLFWPLKKSSHRVG